MGSFHSLSDVQFHCVEHFHANFRGEHFHDFSEPIYKKKSVLKCGTCKVVSDHSLFKSNVIDFVKSKNYAEEPITKQKMHVIGNPYE